MSQNYKANFDSLFSKGIDKFHKREFFNAMTCFQLSLEYLERAPYNNSAMKEQERIEMDLNQSSINDLKSIFEKEVNRGEDLEVNDHSSTEMSLVGTVFDEGFNTFSQVFEQLDDYTEKAVTFFNCAKTYQNLGLKKLSLECYQFCIKNLIERERVFVGSKEINSRKLFSKNEINIILAVLHGIGQVHYFSGTYEKSYAAYELSLKIAREALGYYNLIVASTLCCLGVLNYRKKNSDFAAGIKCFEESIQLRRILCGNQKDVATTLNNLGRTYFRQGKIYEAILVYNEALIIRVNELGATHIDLGATIFNIGQANHAIGQLEEANVHYFKFLHITRLNEMKFHPIVVNVLLSIGQVYKELKNYVQAVKYFEEALETETKVSGVNNAQIAVIHNKLGNSYFETGNNDLAETMYIKGLLIEKQVHGKESYNVVVTLINIAELRKQRKDFRRALILYERALMIQKKILHDGHQDIFLTLSNMGFLFFREGNLSEAMKYYEQALRVKKVNDAIDDDDTASIFTQMGTISLKLNRWESALKFFSAALGILETLIIPCQREISLNLYNLGRVHQHAGNLHEALEFFERSLKLEKEMIDNNHEDISMTLFHIGQIQYEIGNLDEALDRFRDSANIQICSYGKSHSTVARIHSFIGNIHLRKGNIEEAMNIFIDVSRVYRNEGLDHANLEISFFQFHFEHPFGESMIAPAA